MSVVRDPFKKTQHPDGRQLAPVFADGDIDGGRGPPCLGLVLRRATGQAHLNLCSLSEPFEE